jgi:hypothetical protein
MAMHKFQGRPYAASGEDLPAAVLLRSGGTVQDWRTMDARAQYERLAEAERQAQAEQDPGASE